MKEILIHQLEAKKPTKWIKQIKEYLEELQININTIQTSQGWPDLNQAI